MPKHRSANARAMINDTLWGVQRFRFGSRSPSINVSDTEGTAGNPAAAEATGFTAKIPDLREGQFQLVSATYNDDAGYDPFVAPFSIVDGNYYDVKLYPAGVSGNPHHMGSCLLVDISHDGAIPGAQPVTLTFESDAEYFISGQE